MSAFTTDGDFTVAVAVGAARRSFPVDGDTSAQIIEQDFMQFFADFVALDLNTEHPDIAGAFLISESELQDLGGGVARWTRRYATVPATRNEYESTTYTFPGYLGTLTPPYSQYYGQDPTGRDPQNSNAVTSRLEYKYALIGVGQTYTTPAEFFDAESLPAQEYPLTTNSEARMRYLNDASNPGDPETIPNLTDYKALVSTKSELVAEESKMSRWLGNIYVIITRYVTAQ